MAVMSSSEPPRENSWLLDRAERGNPGTRLAAWSSGNRVEVLAHGGTYFAALAAELATVATGDTVLFAQWRGDPAQHVDDGGATIAEALAGAVRRGATLRGLIWRSHSEVMGFQGERNRIFSSEVEQAGGDVLLDQRTRALGSHHQKFVVVRHADDGRADVAFVGGLDLARSRRDDEAHHGDPLVRDFPDVYGERPPWHDVQLRITGPAVAGVEDTFRERWDDPAGTSRLFWRALTDVLHPVTRNPGSLPVVPPVPTPTGSCTVQLLRTYPPRRPRYPFAPRGERSIARGYRKALARAHRLVYVEDQYLWSAEVAAVFAQALERAPQLHLLVVVPRHCDEDGIVGSTVASSGQRVAVERLHQAGPGRVHVLDLENEAGTPIYVHAKLCVVDDVWAAVGSANLSRRSWTYDSELTAAVLDTETDLREPRDPAGLGDGARRFARDLRLSLLREHLGRNEGDDADLIDPDDAVRAVLDQVSALDRWHEGGQRGTRPAGRLRRHHPPARPTWLRALLEPVRHRGADPDGRPAHEKRHSTF